MGSFLVPGYLRLKNPYRWKMDAIGPCSPFTNMLQRHLDMHSWVHFHSLAFKHDCTLAIDKHYKNYILPNMTIFIFFISPQKETSLVQSKQESFWGSGHTNKTNNFPGLNCGSSFTKDTISGSGTISSGSTFVGDAVGAPKDRLR